jgi:hypothetical protein
MDTVARKEIRSRRLEKSILNAMGKDASDRQVVSTKVLVHRNTVENVKTRVFYRFLEDLDYMIELYPIWEKRFKKHPESYSKLRKLARRVKPEV